VTTINKDPETIRARNRKTLGAIKTEDLEVIFPSNGLDVMALKKTDLTISSGEFVCILGPSGCGKSTLLNVIAGFVGATSGSAFLDGNKIESPGSERSMVFQQHSLLPWKTVRENIALGPELIKDNEATKTTDHFLDMVGLKKFEHHYPEQLSGGMQQRVGIARAMATYPKVLLMDEPFGALDYQTRLVMQEHLLQLWAEFNSTVLFVTHDTDEAIFLSDRILVMSASPGRVVLDIENPLPRPRTQLILTDPAFIELKRRCMEIIIKESMQLR
jgi:NitT/TauT family transport system ATP-binding protein